MDGDLAAIQILSFKDDEEKTGTNFMAMYENIKDDRDSYEKKLESNGWNITMTMDMDEGWMIQAEHDENWGMIAQGDNDEEGGVLSFYQE